MKKIKNILFVSTVFILIGCRNQEPKVSQKPKENKENNEQNLAETSNDKCQLIASSSVFLMDEFDDESDEYFRNRNEFIKKYTSEKYESGILTVKTVHLTDPCGGEVGTVKFENDSLKLVTKPTTEMTCNTQELYIFTYKIKTDKKYPVSY